MMFGKGVNKMITLKNIRKNFGNKFVLKGVDIKVDEGVIYGLLGPSGSGKTTLINIMVGKVNDFSGDLLIMNHNKDQLTQKSFKENVGIVSDASSAYSRLTIEENISFFSSLYKVEKSTATWLMKELLLYDQRNEVYKNLSRGMKQRVLLGIALINKPKLLILDEPTSSLDPKTTEKIHRLIENIRESGTTVFLTTHDMEEAEKLCDQISILHHGEIKLSGNTAMILQKNKEIVIETEKQKYKITKSDDLNAYLHGIMRDEKIVDIDVNQHTLRNNFIEMTKESEEERYGE
ncbi:ABC transporter ATP-binding protein [Staphylococcus coagulans]|uniref:ABC transporter ATP-binding protein n=2 Tax=Staphylococcus coagulans TaxID=74706 RepID=UPI001BE57583|nr:ABC transporter ATP-binding protein [Staphylococcus coagulans]